MGKDIVYQYEEGFSMRLILILGVIAAFLSAIFTAGRDGKLPE